MKTESLIDNIYKDGLCLGCGICESICGKEVVEMKLQENGFYKPQIKQIVENDKEQLINKICPGINIVNDIPFPESQKIWGHTEKILSGYSTDSLIRKKGSSGGVVSAIAIYLLEQDFVNGVMQVGGDANDYQRNTLRISRTKQEVLACASSRYAPALVFHKIIEILEANNDVYCFIGKPCDISALKNFLAEFPQYSDRFKIMVSIICAGMPSFTGTKFIIKKLNAIEPVYNLAYRGNGWPGYFSFTDKNNEQYQMTYNDSWGKVLGKHVHFRCKICPDGIGIQADIAVGDAWETDDGYPDFAEREGNSLILIRTKNGLDVLDNMEKVHLLVSNEIDSKTVGLMQPSQLKRRQRVGLRVLAFIIAKRRKLNYRDTGMSQNWKGLKIKTMIKEFYGMFRRSI